MTADHMQGIEKFESEFWKIPDDLRANSGLASNEYFIPILGLPFLRHATNRFYEAKATIKADQIAGKMPKRPDRSRFTRRRALMLPDSTLYETLLELPKDGELCAALTAAMEALVRIRQY
jgi:type I restriction enzyme M protein